MKFFFSKNNTFFPITFYNFLSGQNQSVSKTVNRNKLAGIAASRDVSSFVFSCSGILSEHTVVNSECVKIQQFVAVQGLS